MTFHADLLARQLPASDRLWAAVPEILVGIGYPAGRRPAPPLRRTTHRFSRPRVLDQVKPRHGLQHWKVDDVLYVATTANQRRTLEGVARPSDRDLVTEFDTLRRRMSARMSTAPSVGALRTEIRELTVALAADQFPPGLVRRLAVNHLWMADQHLHRATQLLRRNRPRLLVVATQHSTIIRATILAAWQAGIGVVYFPHAPLADNLTYRDLPADWAGMRGEAEVEHLAAWGADRSRMAVVGDPGTPELAGPPLVRSRRVVVALSALPPAEIEHFIGVIRPSLQDSEVIVAPHPRNDIRLIQRIVPPGWTIHRGSPTASLLSEGAAAVISMNSGVGLEAAVCGIPVVNVVADGATASYLYARELLSSPEIVDTGKLQRSIQEALNLGDEERVALSRRAARWHACNGRAATCKATELLGAAFTAPPSSQPLLDSWGQLRQ